MKPIHISILTGMLFLAFASVFQACTDDEDQGAFTPEDPSLAFGAESIDIAKTAGSFIASITANLPWRAKSNTDWITVNDTTSYGDAGDFVIKLKATRNPTTSPRTGSITVWITRDYSKNIAITQAAGDPPPVVKRNVYVKVDGAGDGTSWETPMSLSAALAMDLDAGDRIHLAAGTYTPAVAVTGGAADAPGDKTFEIRQNIILFGGYPADATTGAIANPAVYSTVLDGGGTANHVVTVTAPTVAGQKVSLKGITMKSGTTASAAGTVTINGLAYSKTQGGGMIIGRATVQLDSCTLSENSAFGGGGAIYCFTNATLTLNKSVIKNNTVSATSANGGGIFMDKQSVLYTYHTTFSANGAGGFAGAAYVYTGACHFYNTTFEGNGAGFVGSGTAGKAYGGLYLREGTGELVNCTVYGNTASNIGGGIGVYGTAAAPASLDVVSCTISGNQVKSATAGGAGLYSNSLFGTINVYNTIISGNTKGATGTEAASDVEGVAGFTWGKHNTLVGNEASFDVATMLGPLTNNGGHTRTMKLTGSNNPAFTDGMTEAELTTLGTTLSTPVPADIITFDQTGESRNGKPYIGATVR